jgi:hypothetical protein
MGVRLPTPINVRGITHSETLSIQRSGGRTALSPSLLEVLGYESA